jgi:RNA polymerase sigma-70 factor (ECF subfamily)
LVDKLPDEYKVVVKMGYYEGYSQSEIAENLSIPLGTVKTRARIGLRELKKLMEN